LVFQICTFFVNPFCLKVFEDGVRGRNFFQKVSSPEKSKQKEVSTYAGRTETAGI
jgi:hypothetical protein